MPKYLVYLRKSRSDSEHETVEEVLAKHYKMIQDYAAAKLGGAIPEELIYREVVSGETIQDRPEMKKILDRIQTEDITGVIVIEPQRLSRGDLSDCGTVIRAFRYTDTLIITPTKTYDLADKFDRKFFEMELTRGNDYLEYVKEIMMRGRIASVQAGNYIGSGSPYGYDKIKDGKTFTLAPNGEADVVRLMFQLWTTGAIGTTTIAYKLNELGIKPRKSERWSSASIRDMLKNPVYIGKIRWNWRKTIKKYDDGEIVSSRPKAKPEDWLIVDGKHEAIISEEVFSAAQERFGKLPKTKPKMKLNNAFAGIMHCACGRSMTYRPQSRSADRLICTNMKYCSNRSAIYQDVVDEVVKALKDFADDFKKLADDPPKISDIQKTTADALIKELHSLETQQERLYEFLEKGIYTAEVFTKRNATLSQRRSELQEAINAAQCNEAQEINYREKYLALIQAIHALEDDTVGVAEKNKLLKFVVKDIIYHRETDIRGKWNNVPFSLEIELL
ncbi:MAG: recombinase family protein [Ruminococcus sp.]|uniref:recombinase family protein n=1 Tax=Ruminococcus sp. TaxID=41978 RepID=UPI0025F39167|nr:recombinase family protein [Ruminococcus sp.]MCR4794219.1 recombinase family protein [Ruminococcus sp.]